MRLNWFFPTKIMIFFFGLSNISTWHFSFLRISNYEYCWAYFGMFIYGFAIIILPFLLIFTLLVRSVEWNEFTICGITFSGLGMLVCYRAGYSLFRVYVQWKTSGGNLEIYVPSVISRNSNSKNKFHKHDFKK